MGRFAAQAWALTPCAKRIKDGANRRPWHPTLSRGGREYSPPRSAGSREQAERLAQPAANRPQELDQGEQVTQGATGAICGEVREHQGAFFRCGVAHDGGLSHSAVDERDYHSDYTEAE